MKEKLMRIAAFALCVVMLLCMVACGAKEQPAPEQNAVQDSLNSEFDPNATEPAVAEPPRAQKVADSDGSLRYVMIYNPNIYKERSGANDQRNTGNFGNQVDTTAVKADGLEMPSDYPFTPWDQGDINVDIPVEELNLDGNRADVMLTPYRVGDVRPFYCYDTQLNRVYKQFTCLYAGTYCNIWTYDSQFNSYAAQVYGETFDAEIYPQMLASFGTARFAENGGKVNLLFYPMADGLAGCFTNADLYSSSEASAEMISYYGMNTDHAILNINSSYAIYEQLVQLMCSTMAHEFQHLICATDSIYALNGEYCSSWLNEAMSGYVEELLYPGAKVISGHYDALAMSDRIRYGQSLYNFDTDNNDIGVYGSVYLYSEFLADLVNEDQTYRNFHDEWRNSYSFTICDAEGLYSIMTQEEIDQVNGIVEYPDSIVFETEAEEWMSKLTFAFYLAMLENSEGGPEAYGYVDPQSLLYDQMGAARIEGGGRIILAVTNGEFQIPADADPGLIYVGLDANFRPVTPVIVG